MSDKIKQCRDCRYSTDEKNCLNPDVALKMLDYYDGTTKTVYASCQQGRIVGKCGTLGNYWIARETGFGT